MRESSKGSRRVGNDKQETVMDAIYRRRSIRKFENYKVPMDDLVAIVKAGMNAPSAGDQQPWRFSIITDSSVLAKASQIHPYFSILSQTPAAIIVCGDLSLERHHGFWVQDCAAATENILLELVDKGYGGVWLGVYPRDERVSSLRRLLSFSQNIVPLSIVALGKAAEKKEWNDKFREERITYY